MEVEEREPDEEELRWITDQEAVFSQWWVQYSHSALRIDKSLASPEVAETARRAALCAWLAKGGGA